MVAELTQMATRESQGIAVHQNESAPPLALITFPKRDNPGLDQSYSDLIDIAYDSQLNGDYSKAVTYYTKAIELNPRIAGVYINRAVAYECLEDLDRALEDLNKANTLEPKGEAYNNRGNIYFKRGEYDRAVQDYSKALEFEPEQCDGA